MQLNIEQPTKHALPASQGNKGLKNERSYSEESADMFGMSSSENLAMLSTADDLN
jgi:hypothetical protein